MLTRSISAMIGWHSDPHQARTRASPNRRISRNARVQPTRPEAEGRTGQQPQSEKAGKHLLEEQAEWARNRGLTLQGSEGKRGVPAYTLRLEDNLFEPMSDEARHEIASGDGTELAGDPCKMQAVHSSSALGVNLFHYWKRIGRLDPVLRACGLPSEGTRTLHFERKMPVASKEYRQVFPKPPNLDLVVDYGRGASIAAVGIECKFTEPFSGPHEGLKPAYLDHRHLWAGLPSCRALAERIEPVDHHFRYLDAAQLLRHLLGLRNNCGDGRYRLLYLYSDAPGEPGTHHAMEIEEFRRIAAMDGIRVQTATVQAIVASLVEQRLEQDKAYVDYSAGRYGSARSL